MINKIKIFSNNNMIRKEEVDVRELNRKVLARAQLKPFRRISCQRIFCTL